MHADALGHPDWAPQFARGPSSVPFPGQGLSGMSPWEYTLAELLSDAGYATALYGKWHLGDHRAGCRTIRASTSGGAS